MDKWKDKINKAWEWCGDWGQAVIFVSVISIFWNLVLVWL